MESQQWEVPTRERKSGACSLGFHPGEPWGPMKPLNIIFPWPVVGISHSGDCESPAAAKSLQSCPTLCDPIDGSPPGSPVPGVLQARTPEWVATSFSNA